MVEFFYVSLFFMICNVDNLINRNIPSLMTFSVWRVCFFIIFAPLLRRENVNVWDGWQRNLWSRNPFFKKHSEGIFKSSPSAMENSKTSSALWLWNMECARMWRSWRQCQTTTIKCVNFSNLLTSPFFKKKSWKSSSAVWQDVEMIKGHLNLKTLTKSQKGSEVSSQMHTKKDTRAWHWNQWRF